LSASQTSALRDLLNEHFANPFADEIAAELLDDDLDALATLDFELRGHPMGEPHAIVPGVPVAVKTTITNGGAKC